MGVVHARRAQALVGTPFRPQGRHPGHGLDCVGLCLAVYRLPSASIRADYRLRGEHRDEIEAVLAKRFRKMAPARGKPGDLILLQPASDQLHFAIMTACGFVHADARLRRIVETPGLPSWPMVGIYRPRREDNC